MKKVTRVLLTLVVMGFMASSASADLIISEIVDGTLPGGQPKFVELTNTGVSSIDLSLYSVGNMNNGATTLGGGTSTALSGTLDPCDSFVLGYFAQSDTTFLDVYGYNVDFFMGGGFINGNDVVILFLGVATGDGSDATIVDVYGRIGQDGLGQDWDYTDGYSRRGPNVCSANPTFTIGEWVVGGANSLEDGGGDDTIERQNLLDLTTPGTHPCCTVAVENIGWGGIKGLYR
jgi:hypothetical protein